MTWHPFVGWPSKIKTFVGPYRGKTKDEKATICLHCSWPEEHPKHMR